MEPTQVFIRLFINVLMLLVTEVHMNYSQQHVSAEIVPTKLQIFEYKSISFDCDSAEVRTGWTVMRRTKDGLSKCVSTWEKNTASSCAIKPAYQTDSGEYWCETSVGERSNTVNITITAGQLLLESPVRPVKEGDDVSLRCRSKSTSSAHTADFYKDGLFIGTGSTGEMSIAGVSKSFEGSYMCSISDFGESPQSWLSVRAAPPETESPSGPPSCHPYLVLRTVSTLLMVALLLLLLGLLHTGRLRLSYVCVCEVCKRSCHTEPNQEVKEDERMRL